MKTALRDRPPEPPSWLPSRWSRSSRPRRRAPPSWPRRPSKELNSAREEAEQVRVLARESAKADLEAARQEARERIAEAQAAADDVLAEAKAVSSGMRQLANLLTVNAERILRDVANSHRAISADLRAASRDEDAPAAAEPESEPAADDAGRRAARAPRSQPRSRARGARAPRRARSATRSTRSTRRTGSTDSVRLIHEHVFVESPNVRGAVAELAIELAAPSWASRSRTGGGARSVRHCLRDRGTRSPRSGASGASSTSRTRRSS